MEYTRRSPLRADAYPLWTMIHTIVRMIRECYPGVVFGGYLLAFFVAFAMVFMLPIGALGLVFLALMALIPVVLILGIVRAIERPLALEKLRAGRCPACSAKSIQPPSTASENCYECAACHERFSARGEDVAAPEPIEVDSINLSESESVKSLE